MDFYKLLEIIGLVVGLLYLALIIGESIWCWIFGIVGSAITVFLYFHTKLYLESILNVYYVWAGFYGWWFWEKEKKKNVGKTNVPVVVWKPLYHGVNIVVCLTLSLIVGLLMARYTDSPRPTVDAAMAIFSFSATYLEARKVLSAWIYWFAINGCAIALQFDRGLNLYAYLSIVYTVMSIVGYFKWRNTYTHQNNTATLPENT
ncbi:MAG: nicotinamide riboside transporter PnuC [Chitinophagaceae bacterium]